MSQLTGVGATVGELALLRLFFSVLAVVVGTVVANFKILSEDATVMESVDAFAASVIEKLQSVDVPAVGYVQC